MQGGLRGAGGLRVAGTSPNEQSMEHINLSPLVFGHVLCCVVFAHVLVLCCVVLCLLMCCVVLCLLMC